MPVSLYLVSSNNMENIISNFRNELGKMVDDVQLSLSKGEPVDSKKIILSFTKEAEQEGNVILSAIPGGTNNKQLKNVITGIIA
ncbi:MAG: hypothetical protein JWQ38_1544, partial [Flavipsychrobacter sp.]|nr:hypothetical protein [Flavipsychrobacter sp.]